MPPPPPPAAASAPGGPRAAQSWQDGGIPWFVGTMLPTVENFATGGAVRVAVWAQRAESSLDGGAARRDCGGGAAESEAAAAREELARREEGRHARGGTHLPPPPSRRDLAARAGPRAAQA